MKTYTKTTKGGEAPANVSNYIEIEHSYPKNNYNFKRYFLKNGKIAGIGTLLILFFLANFFDFEDIEDEQSEEDQQNSSQE